MTLFTPPDVGITDAPYGCLRINAQWYSYISGLISAAEELDYWIDDDLDARDVITELINSYDLVPCEESGMVYTERTILIGYVKPASISGLYINADTWTQIPYNEILRDTHGGVTLNEDGTIIIPAGLWSVSIDQAFGANTGTFRVQTRITDSLLAGYTSGYVFVYQRGRHFLRCAINSDGETPIQVEAISGQACALGHAWDTAPNVFGTIEFRKMAE
jgi:hypothetical protein